MTIDLYHDCRIGKGQQVQTIEQASPRIFRELQRTIGLEKLALDPGIVLLTPEHTAHPLFHGDAYYTRGIDHYRSFGTLFVGNDGNTYTLTVKGGDPFNTNGAPSLASRIVHRQIPGMNELKSAQEEFDAAVVLNSLALDKIGRLTHTAYPVDIRLIHQVPIGWRFEDIKTFMDSDGYDTIPAILKRIEEVPTDKPLGTLILEEHQLKPCELIYLCRGLDIRSHELASSVYFNEANDYLMDDPLCRMEIGVGVLKFGGFFKNSKSKDEVIRNVYGVLMMAYGVDFGRILPENRISDANYLRELHRIPHEIQDEGIADKVIHAFVDRICEVAALAHASRYTLSSLSDSGIGGSLISRNVTYEGVVLDLDTMGQLNGDAADYVVNDFGELLLSVACMRRLVAPRYDLNLFDYVRETYFSKLREFSDDPNWTAKIERAVTSSNISPIIMECFIYSRD